MTPLVAGALEQALAQALDVASGPVDALLRRWFRARPALGRRDRGTIAETVFDVLRNRRLYASLAQSGQGRLERRLMLLSLWRRGALSGSASAEQSWLERTSRVDPASLPAPIALSLPDWLHAALVQTWGEADAHAIASALLAPAPLDLRVNLLKADREQAIQALRADGIEAQPLALAPTALRVDGKPALERSAAFESGQVEVQDAGSQVLALLGAPRRGQTVVDFCAGAGGKTLAMAALMRSTGQIYACDVSASRLARLKPRLARAGATNVQPFAIDSERDRKLDRLAGRADLVLVDAPCSGTGTLRRNPDLKWRLQPAQVAALRTTQPAILRAAARLVKPGGALVYATCSLLPDENEAVAQAFEAGQPQWTRDVPVDLLGWSATEPPGQDVGAPSLVLRPDVHGCDGFFAVRWSLAKR